MGMFDSVFSLGEKLFDTYQASTAAAKANERNVHSYRHRYQWQVEDMRKAGLNPALSYGFTAPVSAAAPMAQMPKGSGVTGGIRELASAGQAKAAEENLQADSELKRAQAMTERNRPENVAADTGLKVAERGKVVVETEVARESVAKVIAETKLAGASAAHQSAAAELARATLPKIIAEIGKLNASALRDSVEAQLRGLEASKLKQLMPYLIQLGVAESYSAQLSLPEREAMAAKWRTAVGQSALPWLREAAGLVPGFGVIVGGKK